MILPWTCSPSIWRSTADWLLPTSVVGWAAGDQSRETHLTSSHLLDPQTGEYNLSYIRQYLPGLKVIVISLVKRQQGLLVAPGNPKSITGLKDLIRDDVNFVNRQRSRNPSAARLSPGRRNQCRPSPGILEEEYTHLGWRLLSLLAGRLWSGDRGCGTLDLDFIPLDEERYDLIVPFEYYEAICSNPCSKSWKMQNFARQLPNFPVMIRCMGIWLL
jgi:putative molybdopterin biosynthesis protein